MIMQRCTPATARRWFKLREAVNWGGSAIVFMVLFGILFFATNLFVALAVSFATAFVLIFLVLDKRALAITCSHSDCAKPIMSNTPWVCGIRKCENYNVDEFSFVNRCEKCGAEPKAYQCHHCGQLIFFSADRQEINYARGINTPVAEDPDKKHEDELTKTKRDIELAELALKKAQVEAAARQFSKTANPEKPKSVRDRLRSKVGSKTELDDEVMRLKAEIDEQFKDDPAERERRYLIVENEARKELW
jgi:hypothetical protein